MRTLSKKRYARVGLTYIPDEGYCIGLSTSAKYSDCFSGKSAKAQALKAAQRLANDYRKTVDVVRVENHGEDRYIIKQIKPRGRPPRGRYV